MREIIDRACRERGWSHARLAREVGITEAGIYQVFRKGNCYMSTLARICQVLGLSLGEFDLRAIPGLRWTAKSEIAKSAQWLARLKGWTDLDLAEHAGLTVGQIQSFMRGVVSPPTTIAAIEAALGEKLDDQLYQSRAWRTYYERHNRDEAT